MAFTNVRERKDYNMEMGKLTKGGVSADIKSLTSLPPRGELSSSKIQLPSRKENQQSADEELFLDMSEYSRRESENELRVRIVNFVLSGYNKAQRITISKSGKAHKDILEVLLEAICEGAMSAKVANQEGDDEWTVYFHNVSFRMLGEKEK